MKFSTCGRVGCLTILAISGTIAVADPLTSARELARDYDLPAQDLGATLRAIARTSGEDILFASDLVKGRAARPVRGHLTIDEALRAALEGSSLLVEDRAGAILIRQRPAQPGGEDRTPPGAPNSITVTGTRIRGAGSASPITVVTRTALEQAGVSDLADFTRILPQNYTGGQNRGIAGGGEQGGQQNLNNSANLNLRGLGPDATLTLVNGHRLSYDALNQGIDISAIPLGAIERVEVVSDGASALYGSDAVAGVANIILRRDYQGVETTARVGGALDGGDFQKEFSLVGGQRWQSGGYMIALDGNLTTPIKAGQRDYTRIVDPSLFLTDRMRSLSGVFNAHQQLLTALRLEIDGSVMDRNSQLQDPFTATRDVHVQGLVSRSHVLSYALTPTLRLSLGPWEASISGTVGDSRTLLDARNYANSVPRRSHLLYEDNLKGSELTAEGPLLELPGGDARLAVGGGLREIWLHDRYHTLTGGQWVTTKNFTERRNVQFAYGELSLPLVGPDLNLPLIERLTLTGALRYERWRRIAAVTTPKLGLIFEPAPDVTVRATWGKSFKIPTLYQVNQIQEGDLIPGFIFNPAPRPAGAPILLLTGSAPNLKPEHATTWSGTVELKPRVLPGLDVRTTYFKVDYRDRIAEPLTSVLSALYDPLYNDFIVYNPTAAQVNALIATLPGGLVNQTGAPFDPSGVGAIIDESLRNTARQRIHGVDVDANYQLELGRNDRLLLTGAASYLESRQQLAPGQSYLPLAGTIFHPPHWRGRGGVVWEEKRTGISAFLNYVGQTTDNTFANVQTVGSFVTVDLSLDFRMGPDAHPMEVRLTALNILNEKPHFIRVVYPEEAPYDSTNESPVGRFLGLSIRKTW